MAVPWPLALLSFWQTLSSRALVQDASRGVLFSLLFFCFLNLFWAAHRLTPAESTGSCGCTQVDYPVTREIHCGVFPPTGDARGGRPVLAARRGVGAESAFRLLSNSAFRVAVRRLACRRFRLLLPPTAANAIYCWVANGDTGIRKTQIHKSEGNICGIETS